MSSKSIHLSEENTEADDDIESDSFERTLSDRAQQIVHELNNKRKQDNELLSAFKASLLSQVCLINCKVSHIMTAITTINIFRTTATKNQITQATTIPLKLK